MVSWKISINSNAISQTQVFEKGDLVGNYEITEQTEFTLIDKDGDFIADEVRFSENGDRNLKDYLSFDLGYKELTQTKSVLNQISKQFGKGKSQIELSGGQEEYTWGNGLSVSVFSGGNAISTLKLNSSETRVNLFFDAGRACLDKNTELGKLCQDLFQAFNEVKQKPEDKKPIKTLDDLFADDRMELKKPLSQIPGNSNKLFKDTEYVKKEIRPLTIGQVERTRIDVTLKSDVKIGEVNKMLETAGIRGIVSLSKTERSIYLTLGTKDQSPEQLQELAKKIDEFSFVVRASAASRSIPN